MTTKAIQTFIDTVIQHFPPFRWDEDQEAAWVETMVRELGGFSETVLKRAVQEMVRTRKERRIPLVSECIDACLEAKRWVEADQQKTSLPVAEPSHPYLDWSDHRIKLANELICGPLGKQAAKEGWIASLHTFIRKNGKLPSHPSDIGKCKRDAAEFDEAYARVVRGEGDRMLNAVLEKLGADMLRKRNELTAMVERS